MATGCECDQSVLKDLCLPHDHARNFLLQPPKIPPKFFKRRKQRPLV
jgi:hypothetical protein